MKFKLNKPLSLSTSSGHPPAGRAGLPLRKGSSLKFKKGFTIVELLVVISIAVILISVVTTSFLKAQKDGRDQRRIDDLKVIQNAAEQYFLLGGSYPSSANYYLVTSIPWTVNSQVILNKIPSDPKTKQSYSNYGVTSSSYCVCAVMENKKNSNAENNQCGFVNSDGFYCIQNQQ